MNTPTPHHYPSYPPYALKNTKQQTTTYIIPIADKPPRILNPIPQINMKTFNAKFLEDNAP